MQFVACEMTLFLFVCFYILNENAHISFKSLMSYRFFPCTIIHIFESNTDANPRALSFFPQSLKCLLKAIHRHSHK